MLVVVARTHLQGGLGRQGILLRHGRSLGPVIEMTQSPCSLAPSAPLLEPLSPAAKPTDLTKRIALIQPSLRVKEKTSGLGHRPGQLAPKTQLERLFPTSSPFTSGTDVAVIPWDGFHAVERHRYLVRDTNSGVSSLIDAAGRIVEETPVISSLVRTPSP